MPYLQYTKCVKPADYSGPIGLLAGVTLAGVLGGVTLNVGFATLGAIIAGIAFCNWWLYGRLVCLGGDRCAVGLALEVFPPQLKTGLNREDTDYSVNILLAPTTLFEGFNQACQDAQGGLLKMSADPNFAKMMKNYPKLGFVGEPEPFSALVDPASQGATYTSSSAGTWMPNTFYAYNALIHDGNSNLQYCNIPGDSGDSTPAWATVGSETTLDGSITWVCLGPDSVLSQVALLNLGLINPVTWAASTPYRVGDLILDSNSTNNTQTGTIVHCGRHVGGSAAEVGRYVRRHDFRNRQQCCLVVPGCRRAMVFDLSRQHVLFSAHDDLSGGDQIIDGNGNLQTCVTGGNSGSTIPAWAIVAGATTTDGQCTLGTASRTLPGRVSRTSLG